MDTKFGRGFTNALYGALWVFIQWITISLVLERRFGLATIIEGPHRIPVHGTDKIALILLTENKRFYDVSQNMYPNHIDALVVMDNRSRQLRLMKKLDLLGPNYKEIYYEHGKRIVHTPVINPSDFCYYEGVVEDDIKSHAAINLCEGKISGTVYLDGQRYDLLSNTTERKLFLVPALTNDTQSGIRCGHSNIPQSTSKQANHQSHTRVKRANKFPSYYKKYVNWKQLYVEMVIVFDSQVYFTSGANKDGLFQRAKELTNYVNSFYQPVNIKVALVGVEIWTDKDRVTVNENGDTTLDQFLNYRKLNLNPIMPNDHAQLITLTHFSGGVVGKAMKGTMCSSELSGAIITDHSRYSATLAATMAHEMGHNFGMEHDNGTCQCDQPKCIMAASSSGSGNMYWSSCSLEYLSWSLSHGADTCLKNKPAHLFDPKYPICGNGFVEEGEQCDCGLPGICDNPCCNATSCQLAQGAACANGDCCDTSKCQVKPIATACRASSGECDLAEYCDGKSELCPNDTYKQNGIGCASGKAYCYHGSCNSQDSQCKLIWGPTGAPGDSECFSLNAKGDAQGNCGYNRITRSYTPCAESDSLCGALQCAQSTEKTQYGDRALVRTAYTEFRYGNSKRFFCYTVNIDLGSDDNDPGLVPNGAQCGKDKMCIDRKCVKVKNIMSESPCDSDCRGNGVCNNFGHCHCDIGYGGHDCGSVGYGGSIDSGPASVGENTTSTIAVTIASSTATRRTTLSSSTPALLVEITNHSVFYTTSEPMLSTSKPTPKEPVLSTSKPMLNGTKGFTVYNNTADSDNIFCILFEACNGFNVGIGVLIFLVVVLPLISALLTYLYRKGKIRSPVVVKVVDKPKSSNNNRPPNSRPAKKTTTSTTVPKHTFKNAIPTTQDWPLPQDHVAATDASKAFPKPTVTVNLQDGLVPVIAAIAASTTALTTQTTFSPPTSAPARPRRPVDDILLKVHQIDETASTSKDAEQGQDKVIMPMRPAPPPPTSYEAEHVFAAPAAVKRKLSEPSAKVNAITSQFENAKIHQKPKQIPSIPTKSAKAVLPPLPASKPKSVPQENSASSDVDTPVSYAKLDKKPKPLPPSKSKVSIEASAEPSKDDGQIYYDVVHSKLNNAIPDPAKSKKAILPPLPKGPKPVTSVVDLKSSGKNDSSSASTPPKVSVPPTGQSKSNGTSKPTPTRKTSSDGVKNESRVVSALAARFENAQNV